MGVELIDRPLRAFDVRIKDAGGLERTMLGVRAYDQHDALGQAVYAAKEETGLDDWFLVRIGLSALTTCRTPSGSGLHFMRAGERRTLCGVEAFPVGQTKGRDLALETDCSKCLRSAT